MRGFTPKIEISTQVEGKIFGASSSFYSRLIKATLKDEEGQKSDSLTFDLDNRNEEIEPPQKGTKLFVSLGYAETGLIEKGVFEVHGTEENFSTDAGETITVQCKGTSLSSSSSLKAMGSESFIEHSTLEQIAGKIAKKSGLILRIAQSLGEIKFEEGLYKHLQSDLDFLGKIVSQKNGLLKITANVLSITERGSGKNAKGEDLPQILLNKSDCKSGSFTPNDRVGFNKVQAQWIDQKTGKKNKTEQETGIEGPLYTLKETYRNEVEAQKAAQSKAKELSRKSGSASFTLYGKPELSAGLNIIVSGFASRNNGIWRITSAEHVFTSGASGGYLTTITCDAPEGGKKIEKEE